MPKEDVEEETLEDEDELPEDLDEDDLEDLDEDGPDLDDDDLDDSDADVDVDDELDAAVLEEGTTEVEGKARDDEEEDDDEDDEDSDDVEASLDVILKERLVVVDDEDEDDDEDVADGEDRGESPLKVLPKQPGEFVCQSCFLVKHPSQMADEARGLCRDCV